MRHRAPVYTATMPGPGPCVFKGVDLILKKRVAQHRVYKKPGYPHDGHEPEHHKYRERHP